LVPEYGHVCCAPIVHRCQAVNNYVHMACQSCAATLAVADMPGHLGIFCAGTMAPAMKRALDSCLGEPAFAGDMAMPLLKKPSSGLDAMKPPVSVFLSWCSDRMQGCCI
jgi:hypothetical protein